ncbi:hypothetical protein D7X30_23630 [Corallococcus sp. AB011P]|nr:hypothetical protein D7X30_23630 [Corallococcus sp. AB011P]RKH89392.1 hypothetical protein D7Y21_10865 [Corallococcus sp. AB045]
MLGLAVIGVQFGCGMEEAEQRATSELAAREDALYRCTTDSLTIYYSDATYTTEVGSDRCFCGRTPLRTGQMTGYALIGFSEDCPGLAPAAP